MAITGIEFVRRNLVEQVTRKADKLFAPETPASKTSLLHGPCWSTTHSAYSQRILICQISPTNSNHIYQRRRWTTMMGTAAANRGLDVNRIFGGHTGFNDNDLGSYRRTSISWQYHTFITAPTVYILSSESTGRVGLWKGCHVALSSWLH